MPLNPSQAQTAQLIYTLAKARGLPDQRAREMVAASYAESGLNPSARNKSSGASGLFQLLSSGYVSKANAQGGTTNPRANFNAIAPDYVSYWQSHPNAAPGEAAAAVERSGQGAGFYSAPLAKIGALGAARNPGVDSLTSLGLSSSSAGQPAAGPDPSLRRAFAMQLIAANQAGQGGRTVDYAPVLQSLSALRQGGSQAVDSQPMNAAPPGAGMPNAGPGGPPPTGKPSIPFLEKFAQPFGLTVTSTTGGGHAAHSYHYQGRAVDFGGDPGKMAQLAAYALQHPGQFTEMFYTGPGHPGYFISGGKVLPLSQLDKGLYNEHTNHVHLAR